MDELEKISQAGGVEFINFSRVHLVEGVIAPAGFLALWGQKPEEAP